MADSAPIELCPRCAIRDIEDEASGWCLKCAEAAALERYRDRNDQEVARLRENWRGRTKRAFSDAPAALAERQQWHRLLEKTKPRQPVDSYVNPLQLAFDALQQLNHVKGAIRSNGRARDHIERVEEAIRQLAWGSGVRTFAPEGRTEVLPGQDRDAQPVASGRREALHLPPGLSGSAALSPLGLAPTAPWLYGLPTAPNTRSSGPEGSGTVPVSVRPHQWGTYSACPTALGGPCIRFQQGRTLVPRQDEGGGYGTPE
jgi:hypothetical protein